MGKLFVVAFLFLAGCSSLFSSEDKETARMHLQIGTSHLQNGNYPLALQELQRAESLDDENPFIQNNLGLTYFFRERYDLAELHIRRALDNNAGYSDARNNLARVLIERGQLQQAIVEAKRVTQDLTYSSPEKPYINIGLAYFKLKQFSPAKEAFAKATDFSKDNCLANSYLGRCSFELKEYSKAASALDRAVGFCQRSQFDEPHYYSALAYYELGQKDRSVARFEEIIKLYPYGKYVDRAKDMLETIKR